MIESARSMKVFENLQAILIERAWTKQTRDNFVLNLLEFCAC